MKKISFSTFLFILLSLSVAINFVLAFAIADQSKQCAWYVECNDFKFELLQHYDRMYNLIMQCDNEYNWSDMYGSEPYDSIWVEMDKIDSLYATQL